MTISTPGFVGPRLTQARQARGISATDLASLVGVSLQSISKYENEHQTPKLDVLHKLAAALNMPRSYFFRPMTDADQTPVYWRSRLSAPPVMRDRAGVRLEWMKELVDYIAGYFDLMPLNVPEIDRALNSFDAIENVAIAIRRHWGIRPGPMPDVLEKLETNGILVSRIHVGAEKLDAFSQWSSRFKVPFIMLSRDKSSAVRQRFDALHELVHIVCHRAVAIKRMNDRAFYKNMEKQDDRLACALLLPAKEFLDELYAPSLDAFVALKERWGASVGAMIMRCHALDLLDEDEVRRMWINYNRRGWRNGEPLDARLPKEAPFILRRSIEMLISEKVQSPSEILAALPFPAEDLEELAVLVPGTLTGQTEMRPEPLLKPQFKASESNVIHIFSKKES
jgi:Zn-dependent peptidase ImmA (M78 family)/transcriptional regulator with XRE-family HTH domain